VAKPNIDSVKLRQLANSVGVSDKARLDRVINRLELGADIGCRGEPRMPTNSKNSKDAYEHGHQVTDAIASWIRAGYVFGPVTPEDSPQDKKVNGIMTRTKPDGSVRVILNLSAPAGCSVNDGIDKNDFPAVMSSTKAWLDVLNSAGQNCWISKTDWADAYKHFTVRQQDLNLQWFEWGGMLFREQCLVFGGTSSAGIFDDGAKLFTDLGVRMAEFSPDLICQHLDDICAAAPCFSQKLHQLEEAFQKLANFIGVKLRTILSAESCHRKEVKSLAGKLIHIKALMPTARFNCDHIMAWLSDSNKNNPVPTNSACKRQLQFWADLLLTCNGHLKIPEVPTSTPADALQVFCDAAGGSTDGIGRGSGGVCGPLWYYEQWPSAINAGSARWEGKKVGRKLTALELLGPLCFAAAAPDAFRRRCVVFWIDNAGSVAVWEKGYSAHCRMSTCIVKATATVMAAIGCNAIFKKITRCSNTGAKLADALSKAEFSNFFNIADDAKWGLCQEPIRIPTSIRTWIQNPTDDDDWGKKIVNQIKTYTAIIGDPNKCSNNSFYQPEIN